MKDNDPRDGVEQHRDWLKDRLVQAVTVLTIIRDADEDCRRDGLPARMPLASRAMCDAAIDAAQGAT